MYFYFFNTYKFYNSNWTAKDCKTIFIKLKINLKIANNPSKVKLFKR